VLPACDFEVGAMCEKCAELDSKIEHYRFMASRITDQPLLDGIKELIEQMQAQKVALLPEQE
jgi:beta-phosphoglucomutase-like phosphatase (HAD superfamily)